MEVIFKCSSLLPEMALNISTGQKWWGETPQEWDETWRTWSDEKSWTSACTERHLILSSMKPSRTCAIWCFQYCNTQWNGLFIHFPAAQVQCSVICAQDGRAIFKKKNLKWGLKLMYAVLLLLLLFSIVEIEFEDCESQIVCHSQVWR